MEFNEDPFKDADHRYGDPFDIEGADPFKNEQDPFTASVDDAFGTLPRSSKSQTTETKNLDWPNDAWGASTAQDDPFKMLSGSVKNTQAPSNNLDDSFDPFSAKNLQPKTDPFSSSKTNSDPFSASNNVDPFGSSSAWSSDPFSAVPVSRSKTSIDPFSNTKKSHALQKSETSSKVSQSLSRPWSSKDDPFHASSIPRSRPTSSKTADPFSVAPALDLSSVSEKKEKKNNFKLGHFKPFSGKKDKNKDKSGHKMIKNDLSSAGGTPVVGEEAHLRMASEASKKAEEERLQRLRQQEEQDLAYAIALSKAEAASLQQ